MNASMRRMLDILRDLKETHGVAAIKAEFEAEGTRTDELVMLNEVVFRADLDVFIKIGGCEAVRDMEECRVLGARGIMAPMIETPFAMSKFISSIDKVYTEEEQKRLEFIINAETKTFYANMGEILTMPNARKVHTMVVGRVDFSASMGLTRADINGDAMLRYTTDIVDATKQNGFIAGFGGGISLDALDFIARLIGKADKFETRKVVFPLRPDARIDDIRRGIVKAMEFETLYLKNKCEFYSRMADEDAARLKMMAARLEQAKASIN